MKASGLSGGWRTRTTGAWVRSSGRSISVNENVSALEPSIVTEDG